MLRRSLLFVALALGSVPGLPRPLSAQEAQAAVPRRSMAESLLGNFSLADRSEPIEVRADSAEFSYRDLVLTYRGNVIASQGDVVLRSDSLRIALARAGDRARFDAASERVAQVVAEGNVHITKGSRSATGGRAVFDEAERTVVLSEDAVLFDGPNQISGKRVVVYLDEERSVVESGDRRRVQAVLYPDKIKDEKSGGVE